ncbi:PF11074 domain protein [Leptospira interrogans serovar Bataviae str. HAI135]|nr:PF11074 domain protein [Leptospira interrogans serovar Bataviae str. HAI135]
MEESVAIFPEYKDWLKSIQDNFLDLATPFWGYEYYHPDQKGSTSLKTILPIITGQNYKNLEIQSGQIANSEFLRVKTEPMSENEKKK